MATIQDYLEAAKGAIISGACDRAIGLCQDVLAHYPKHIEAHCLLAEAYREQGNEATAEDLLLRVLSADPENLIARWALSTVHDERGERGDAVGQLRIALEVRPDHAELREELVQLSGDRVKPTRGGLARLYLRGGLFECAVTEFKAAIAREPKRLDLLVGLAEALWRGGQAEEAGEVSRRILEDAPDCLKALLINGFVALGRGRPLNENERAMWATAHALEPDHRVADELAADITRNKLHNWQELLPISGEIDGKDAGDVEPDLLALPSTEPFGTLTPVDEERIDPSMDLREPTDTDLGVDELTGDLGLTAKMSDGQHVTSADREALPFEPELAELVRQMEEAERALQVEEAKQAAQVEEARRVAQVEQVDQAVAASTHTPSKGQIGQFDLTEPQEWPPAAGDEPRTAETTDTGDWGAWASLLDEEITLDADAEARLSAVLAEMQSQQGQNRTPVASRAASTASGAAAAGPVTPGVAEGSTASQLRPYLEAVQSDPSNKTAVLSLADAYQKTGMPDAAVAEYRKLVQGAPELSREVVDGLRELLHAVPGHADAHRVLGDVYMKGGRFQQAIDEYNQALSLEKVRG